ncbi:MAG: exo-alpha-sialidase [Pirellulaceae bacterium]|nr:exo-alpha-sialidase [Pirellulaceae bacterium]
MKTPTVAVQKIWDAAPHNAFTDLVRFQDQWFCVFREGAGHVSADGALRVITSRDGVDWDAAARLTMPGADLRDAKITVTPDQRLMLSGAAAYHQPADHTHQSLVWFSDDGFHWSPPTQVGDPDFWLWRVVWNEATALGFGYGTRAENRSLRLYQTQDGKTYETLAANVFDEGYPNETGLVFRDDGSCICLLRRDGEKSSAQLGVSQKPYRQWEWKDLGVQIGGPQMIELPDGRLIAGVRLYDGGARTAICQIDPQKGSLKELLLLPSSGDNSYPGLVWHAGRLWVSYYSSHEGKTSIYFANFALPDP